MLFDKNKKIFDSARTIRQNVTLLWVKGQGGKLDVVSVQLV
ncbi:FolC bifunctional protein [Alicyclobacillus hesperidum URH17-3-68]|nr:FolC bifunctional protein [Alicyclobacillus hesperidum URH17-3-68]